jgi:hypothetical protein
MMQDDNDTDREISENEREDPGADTLSSNIEKDDLDNQQEVQHQYQTHCHKTIQTSRVPPPKQRSRADTVIARIALPNL